MKFYAYCSSAMCYSENKKRTDNNPNGLSMVKKENQKKDAVWCSDCGHALYWTTSEIYRAKYNDYHKKKEKNV